MVQGPVRTRGNELVITTTIGICVYPVSGKDDAQELMKKADIAMYAAKQAGRNRFKFFALEN
ncbi:diguanylate cyclase domain-containing protein [Propionivibrio dicarboxylicus]|uniref:diguanylate cyclase domain-containing protein n=1 Tax=Propionivibrio dicarboxylicus TaxID=83767 RepID=UPI000B82B61D